MMKAGPSPLAKILSRSCRSSIGPPTAIFTKLGVVEEEDVNWRVLAVLTYLSQAD